MLLLPSSWYALGMLDGIARDSRIPARVAQTPELFLAPLAKFTRAYLRALSKLPHGVAVFLTY
ncbi:hypothetical protein [Adlercreutzia sp. ZJ242]|uniref:hypothetical protein n=1 Tax=Adlercreutzia sp. ZJ242 TaxID=2709409 RepID=UPI0019810C97|nr:hypothetical protein [Adlercreutzia sp. ZJ242]